jgi:cellulose synthase/poly-beta-1,6-N-acetylglucosamine synthase-like glycosyltransferase
VLREFNLYDLFVLSFVQLLLSTVLVLSPARDIGTRFRWTGSKITEVLLGAIGAAAISALSCFVTAELWGLAAGGLETAAYLLTIFSVVVIVLRPDCNIVGQVFYASYAAAGFTFLAFAGLVAAAAVRSIGEAVTSSLLILLDFAAFLVWNSNINYVSDVLCRTRRSRPLPAADPNYKPMVSIHIPAYNEPPELLIETIKAAERLDYPDFEIIVIDNNTADPSVYGPVERYCQDRERVRFVHVVPWPGYKAGACNLALRRYTDPRAEIIGLIDADDLVQPHYLRETVPYFSDPGLGFVQTFEGNRDFEGSAYYTACVDSYQAFYLAHMSSRNERDSVPFVGTMGLFRRSALAEVGGWNEWCISEDTEASLRVLRTGWSGLYVPRCFGRGIVPPSFAGMLTQRHRWCFGAMQILRLHWRSLMPWDRSPENHLTSGQRRDYLMASLGWFRDLLMIAFTALLLVITGLLVAGSHFALIPIAGDRSLLPMSLIIIATICMLWTLRHWTTMTRTRALLALVVSLSASRVIALACVEGMSRRDGVFLRTSKAGGIRHRFRKALWIIRWEGLLAAALYASAGLLSTLSHPPLLLIVIICLQGTVYLCGPIASLWNLRAQRASAADYRQRHEERRLRRTARSRVWSRIPGVVAASVFAVGVGGITSALVAPASLIRASVVIHKKLSPQSIVDSQGTEVYLRYGPDASQRGASLYYPVTGVVLSQLESASTGSPAHFSLSFQVSSLGLLDEVVAHDRSASSAPLTLVVRRLAIGHKLAATELADSFESAKVTSFTESLSGPPAGIVWLSLSPFGHLLTSAKSLAGLGPFARTPVASRASVARVYLKLGPTRSKSSYYPVTAAVLSQMTPAAPGSLTRLSLSFGTSSLTLLNNVLRESGPGRQIPGLSMLVRKTGSEGAGATTEVAYSFSKAVVASFDENLSGAPTGKITLSLP